MFRNRDKGLSNCLNWFFEVRNWAYMENYHNVLKVKLQKIPKTQERFPKTQERFSVHTNGKQTCLFKLLLVSETSTMSSTIKL